MYPVPVFGTGTVALNSFIFPLQSRFLFKFQNLMYGIYDLCRRCKERRKTSNGTRKRTTKRRERAMTSQDEGDLKDDNDD